MIYMCSLPAFRGWMLLRCRMERGQMLALPTFVWFGLRLRNSAAVRGHAIRASEAV